MSTPVPAAAPPQAKFKPKKSKENPRDRERKEKPQLPSERLKIVVRRLPPNLPEEIFWQSVSNWVTDETVTWKAYFPGKPRKRMNGENIPSRAYIAFKDPEQLLVFGRGYDGHKFVDKAGNESYAVVEFSPYQKVPSEKKKPDARNATIEKDEDFISFLESLQAPPSEPVSLETLIASTRPPSPPKTTPLLEALKAEKQAQKDKEAIIRHHPHYKDVMNAPIPATILRKEEKRRAAAAAKAEAHAASGKKGKKGHAHPAAPQTVKQVQIQTKPTTNANANANPNPTAVATPPTKPPPQQSKGSRGSRHHARNPAPTTATPVTAAANVAPTPAPKDTLPPAANDIASPITPTSATADASSSARRARPVLGLGSRQFSAALNGAGVTPTSERRRKGKDSVLPSTSSPIVPGTSNEGGTGAPPISPKRPRHRKDTGSGGGVGTEPVAVSGELGPLPGSIEGAVPHPGAGRGGRRGRGGGRGRGGPPRIG